MPSQVPLPPWLNISPTAPVQGMLEGYGLGLRASEARQAQAARAQQQMLAQQQAAELNAYRQQQQALEQQQFTENLRLAQQKAEREAKVAALQMEGMNEAQTLQAQGLEWPQILAKVGPKLFAGDPRGLGLGMQGLQRTAPHTPVYGKSPEGVPFYRDPQTGRLSFIPASALKQAGAVGGAGTDLTTAAKTQMQRSLQEGEKAVELGKQLLENLVPGAVGLRGSLNKLAVNTGLAEIFPGLRDQDVTNAQTLIGAFNERIINAIKAAGAVSNFERKMYLENLPKAGVGDTIDTAKDKINTFLTVIRQEKAKDATRLGLEKPLWTMSKEEIRDLYRAGKLGRDEAAAAIERYFPRGR